MLIYVFQIEVSAVKVPTNNEQSKQYNEPHSYLATFLGTNSLSVLMCRKAVNQSINEPHKF